MNNDRIIRQQAAAILFCGKDIDYNSNMIQSTDVIRISKSHINYIHENLHRLGISNEFLFPELSVYTEVLKERTDISKTTKTNNKSKKK